MHGRIGVRRYQNLRDHGRGRGLSVRTAHADSGRAAVHQLPEQLRAFDFRDAEARGFHALFVIGRDRNGVHDQIGVLHVFFMMADGDGDSHRAQTLGRVGLKIITAGEGISLFMQHTRQPAHAAAADPDHMDALMQIVFDMR